jgi:methionine-rich copper-binding protein CopC
MPHRRIRARALTTVSAIVAGVLAVPAPAWAHTELSGTSPVALATVTSPISEVTLTFTGAVRADGSSVEVAGADGQVYSDAALSVLNFVVHQPVAPLRSGQYRVEWRVVAGDGHPMTGEFMFEVALPPELEPTGSPTPAHSEPTPTASAGVAIDTTDDGSSAALWWALGGALGAVLIALLVLLGMRRGRHG